MIRTLLLLGLLTLPACRSRPIQTVLRGAMQMTGGMRLDGDMDMSGEISTVIKSDNRASRLVSVPVYAKPGSTTVGKVAVLDVDGLLLNRNMSGYGSMGENPVAIFREKLDALATDPGVAAIVLRINSPGGGVTAADMMARDLLQLKMQLNVPVVACLMDVGAGGGYYLATAADQIIAHPTSVVGGIGVILNVFNLDTALAQFLISSIPIKAGEKIDMASPLREMTQTERDMLQSIADEFHQRFIEQVTSARPAQLDREIFDGRVVTGVQARDLGLVDQVGYLDDAIVAARSLADLPLDAPVVMLRRENDRAYTLLDVTPNVPTTSNIVSLNVPGLERSKMPTFLYLWQPEPRIVTSTE